MIIPPGIGKHIVGKKGKTIRDMQMRHKVEILTASQRDNDETQITITGPSKPNTNVIEDITKIITKQLDEQTKTTPKKEDHEGNICRYQKEGNCHYGDKCWRLHINQSINQSINLFQFASFYTVLYIHYNSLNTIRHKLGLYQR